MKTHSLLGLTVLALMLGSCNQNDYPTKTEPLSDRLNEYTQSWIDYFGLVDSKQNWCMLNAVEAEVDMNALADGAVARIYNATPADGGHIIGTATGDTNMLLDMRKDATRVYAEMIDADGAVISAGYYDIANGRVRIDGSCADEAPSSRYAHDPSWFDAMIICEDLGGIGDYDFNDIVLGIRRVNNTATLSITPMAAGGELEAVIKFQGEEKGEIHTLIDPNAQTGVMLNTRSFKQAGDVINLTVDTKWTIANNWKDITIEVRDADETIEIKAPTEGKAPQMICLAGDWFWPVEKTGIDFAYESFTDWNADGSLNDWVDSNKDASLVVPWSIQQVAPCWFSATTNNGASYTAKVNGTQNETIQSGNQYGLYPPVSCAYMFSEKPELTSVDIDGEHFITTNVTTTNYMFNGCTGLTSIDLSNWDTPVLNNVSSMFSGCSNLEDLNLSGWDITHLGTYNYSDFTEGCEALTHLTIKNAKLDSRFSSWDGWRRGIVNGCYKHISTLDADNCTYFGTSISEVFSGWTSLETVNVSGWKFPDATSLSSIFYNCTSLESIDLESWDISNVTSLSSMFAGCTNLSSVDMTGWRTDELKTTNGMFEGCNHITSLDLSGWNTESLTSTGLMFNGCSSLETLNLSGWHLGNLKSHYDYTNMTCGCTSLKNLIINGATVRNTLGAWDGYHNGMFDGCHSYVTNLQAKNCVVEGTSLSRTFRYWTGLTTLDLSGWQTADVTNMFEMFIGCSNLKTVNMDRWDVKKVTNLSSLFYNCESLEDAGMAGWETTALESTSSMFYGCTSLTSLDLTGWDLSNVTNHSSMFTNCPAMTIKCSQATEDILRSWNVVPAGSTFTR